MGLFDWFRKLAVGETAPASEAPGDGSAQVSGLDFYKAIEAHQGWKVRLSAYVKGEGTERLDWQVVCRDDQCALGKWLHHEAQVPSGQQGLFTRLIDEHAEFHRRAGDVVQLADRGERAAALDMVRAGEYARASQKVIATLSQMYLALNDARV